MAQLTVGDIVTVRSEHAGSRLPLGELFVVDAVYNYSDGDRNEPKVDIRSVKTERVQRGWFAFRFKKVELAEDLTVEVDYGI